MALQKNYVEIPFAKGLNQKVDARLLQVGSQTTLSNLVQDKFGQFTKRPGTVDLGVSSSSKSGHALLSPGAGNLSARLIPQPTDGVAQVNGYRLWSRSPLSSNNTTTYDLDDVTSVLTQRYGIEVGPKAFNCFDIASDGNRILVVWLSPQALSQQPFYCVLDATTLQTIVPPQADQTGSFTPGTATNWLRIASMPGGPQNTVGVVWQVANTLYGSLFTFSTLSWGAPIPLVTDCNTTTSPGTIFGIYGCSMIDVSNMALAYGTTANPPVCKAISFAVAGWSQNAVQSVTPPGATGLHLHSVAIESPGGSHTWIAYSVSGVSSNAQRAFAVHTSNFGTLDAADTALWSESGVFPYRLGIIPQPVGISGCVVVGCRTDNGTVPTLNWIRFDIGPTVGTLASRYGLILAAKPCTVTGKNVALVCYAQGNPSFGLTEVQRTYWVVELKYGQALGLNDAVPLSTIAPRIVSDGGQGLLNLPNSISLSLFTSAERFITVGCTIRSAAGGYGVDLLDTRFVRALWQPAILGGVTYLSGGIPCAFDGDRVTEIGMLYQPPFISATVASSSGGGVGPSSGSYVYTYSAVYEWRDKTGQRCQSRPTSTTVTVSTNVSQILVTVPPINLTLRQDFESNYQQQIGIAIYRDTATSPGNSVRVFSADIPAALLNTLGSASLTYTDVASDASIAANEPLYTSGGAALDAVCPSSLSSLIMHNNRLFGVGDDGTTIWYTTTYDGGSTQPYFNDGLILLMPQRATAIASMDGKLLVFSRDSIYLYTGDGPTVSGVNDTWSPPQKLQVDVGCASDWRSVVGFSGGVVFQSGAKLYLLSRSLEVSYFSGAIEDTLTANPVVTFAVLHSARNELRFGLKPNETSLTGVVANYNYVTDTWSTFSYYDQDASAFGADVDTAITVSGNWYHGTLSGRVWTENALSNGYDVDNAYLTNGGLLNTAHWISYTVDTANIKASGVQGFGRFWDGVLMLQPGSPCDVTIQVAYDYSDSFIDSRTFTAATIATFTTPKPQMRVGFTRQKVESVRLRVSDAAPTGVVQTTGAGASLVSIGLTIGAKTGRIPLPANQGQ